MPTKVVVKKCQKYNADEIYGKLKDGINLLGGISSFVKKGERVLLKPNMLRGAPPERAVNTHPVVLEAMGRLVLEAGGIPKIGDSPGFSTISEAPRLAGYDAVAKRLGIECRVFDKPLKVGFREGKFYKSFEVDRDIVESDKIINIAKLKTHPQMHMTLAVKNMFGAMVGQEKAWRHLIAGHRYDLFALMLVELYRFTKPCLSIVDGILTMEGNGPASGTPRHIGMLVLGRDAVSVDRIICEIIGVKPEKVPIFEAARKLGVGEQDIKAIEILGDPIAELKIRDFKEIETSLPIELIPLPDFIRDKLKDLLTVKPIISKNVCTKCGICEKSCPVKAITLSKGGMEIYYNKCIRCFCCQEHCPEGAIAAKRNKIGQLMAKLLNWLPL